MKYREALIFIIGTTPQIITETLYALHHKKPSIHPDEIFIITTTKGKEKAERELITRGRLFSFYKEYNIKPVLPFFLLVSGRDGKPLEDIRSAADNESLGDFIVQFIRKKTENNNMRLHCSIAGGRKTMSFYLGSALSLFGRSWDKLYHVLVTPEFESHPDFYWKPRKYRRLQTAGGKDLNTGEAEITLAELPFIHLRHKLSLERRGFRELVAAGQEEINAAPIQLPLKIDLNQRSIAIGLDKIKLTPVQLALYNAMLNQKIKRCSHPRIKVCRDCTDCYITPEGKAIANHTILTEMQKTYEEIYGQNSGMTIKFQRYLEKGNGIGVEIFRQNISKINGAIQKNLPDNILAAFYLISAVGGWGSTKYGIKLEKRKIQVG